MSNSAMTHVGLPLISINEGQGAVPSHIKIEKILLFSTADGNTGFQRGEAANVSSLDGAYDISQVVTELELVESIFSLAVTGSITIVDNFNFFQDARIHGQEKLFITFRRYNPQSNTYDTKFDREYLVTNMSRYERSEFKSVFTLDFASPHVYLDKIKRIGRAYGYNDITPTSNDLSGSAEAIEGWRGKYSSEANKYIEYDEISSVYGLQGDEDLHSNTTFSRIKNSFEYPEQFIYDILRNDLEIPVNRVWLYGYTSTMASGKRSSFSRMKVIIPNWRPFQSIKWLIRNTISAESKYIGQPWFCYDTIIAGIRIEPYSIIIKDEDEMTPDELHSTGRIKKNLVGAYLFNPQYNADPASPTFYTDMHKKILEMKMGFSFDQFTKAANGSYASQAFYVDIASKFIYPNLYGQIDQTTLHHDTIGFEQGKDYLDGLAGKPHYPPFAKDVNANAADMKMTNYTYYVPFNSALHGTSDNTFVYNFAFGYPEKSVGLTTSFTGGETGSYSAQGVEVGGEWSPPSTSGPAPQSTAVVYTSPYNRLPAAIGVSQSDWNTYRRTVAHIESGGTGYPIQGGSSGLYDGAFQIGTPGRTDAHKLLGTPMTSRAAFRANADLQEQVMDAYTVKNHDYLKGGSAASIYNALSPREQLIVLAFAHNQGHGGAATWLRTGVVGKDAFGTAGSKYSNAVSANLAISSEEQTQPEPEEEVVVEEQTKADDEKNTTNTETTENAAENTPQLPELPSGTPSQSDATTPQSIGKVGRSADMVKKNMDFMQHTIKVMGDFRLNPGLTISIDVQKTIDPQLLQKMDGMRDTDNYVDEYISGKYFVSECRHVFKERMFYTYATINRDSSSIDLNSSQVAIQL